MISEIVMQGKETCFKNKASLKCNHKVNLIYGLNGTGKSTISQFLYNYPDCNDRFSNCIINNLNSDEELLVYNSQFISNNFYESETQKGIFSLNSENKKALEIINNELKKIREIDKQLSIEEENKNRIVDNVNRCRKLAVNETWKIKTQYTGGDRVLEKCFEGLGVKGSAEKLFDYVCSIELPIEEPKSLESIKKDIQLYFDDSQKEIKAIIIPDYNGIRVEKDSILKKAIVGNQNSTVADVIKRLNNSDWVKQGLTYIIDPIKASVGKCPFCQSNTITKQLVEELKKYFDESYENDKSYLYLMLEKYKEEQVKISSIDFSEASFLDNEVLLQIRSKKMVLERRIIDNINLINTKITNPSVPIILDFTDQMFDELKSSLNLANEYICARNEKLKEKDKNFGIAKKEFWILMRLKYDYAIKRYTDETKDINKNYKKVEEAILQLQKEKTVHENAIQEKQKQTVNIDEAITRINNSLVDLGIIDFSIKKYDNSLYSITRIGDDKPVFRTLSEGEKMVISFLYFIELCRGRSSSTEVPQKKIIIIDDPISSLSHIYVYNIGRLIQQEFIRSGKYEQLFVLSHSLYFIYELIDNSKERREKKDEQLYRIIKNTDGSTFEEMNYENIQNDYQTYWTIVRDAKNNPALIANCMRNIIEYFFGFVEKSDLNNVFQQDKLSNSKFQAFVRYINRESHSVSQNVFDIKEFDYDIFSEAFRCVFELTGYEKHYKKMMRL